MMWVLLLAWVVANLVPHLVVYLATGRIYYRLSTGRRIVAESAIMLLNLALPVLVLLPGPAAGPEGGVLASLGWRWNGWATLGIGLLGLVVALAILSRRSGGSATRSRRPGGGPRAPASWPRCWRCCWC